MLFKIKRFLLPALISISKQLDYKDFIDHVYSVFKLFITDEIWGVRKAGIECMADLIKYLKHDDIEKLKNCF